MEEAREELKRMINNKSHTISEDLLRIVYDAVCEIENKKCNGYKNHATWELAVIIDNDESLYKFWNEIATKTTETELADHLKQWIQDIYEVIRRDLENNKIGNVILHTFDCMYNTTASTIDYYHIARGLLE